MSLFDYADSAVEIDPVVAESHRSVWDQLRRTGTWWTGEQMLAIAGRARTVFAQRATAPWLVELSTTDDVLSRSTLTAIDTIARTPSAANREWALRRVKELGAGPYVELVGVVATIVMVDMFAVAAGVAATPLPQADPGGTAPSRETPEGLADIGAHVPMLEPFDYANVARALSMVPSSNRLFRTTSVPMYSAPGMSDLVWSTPLERPQVELIAARVAALCFY